MWYPVEWKWLNWVSVHNVGVWPMLLYLSMVRQIIMAAVNWIMFMGDAVGPHFPY